MKKRPVSIKNGKLTYYDDPLCHNTPTTETISKKTLEQFPTKEIPVKTVSPDDIIYHKRFIFRGKMYLISFMLIILCGVLLTYSYNSFIIQLLTRGIGVLSIYFFLRMFFLEIGKSSKKKRRLKASRIILYVVILGGEIFHCIYIILIYKLFGFTIEPWSDYGDKYIHFFMSLPVEENIFRLIIEITLLVLWIISIMIAIINKIQVNVHNQE